MAMKSISLLALSDGWPVYYNVVWVRLISEPRCLVDIKVYQDTLFDGLSLYIDPPLNNNSIPDNLMKLLRQFIRLDKIYDESIFYEGNEILGKEGEAGVGR